MAIGGQRPKPTALRLITKAGHRPIPEGEPEVSGSPVKPQKLRGRMLELWDEVVIRAPWLGEADSYKLHVWCALHAEFERGPSKMLSARIAQLRAAGSELGLDPSARARLGQKGNIGAKKDDPASEYGL